MKVYITSDDKSFGISAANILNGRQDMNAILSEEILESYEDIIYDVSENINKNFDYIIVISNNPYKASIDINKIGDARAITCKAREDIDIACGSAKANVIIFDSTKQKKQIVDLIEEFASSVFKSPEKIDYIKNNAQVPEIREERVKFTRRGINKIKEAIAKGAKYKGQRSKENLKSLIMKRKINKRKLLDKEGEKRNDDRKNTNKEKKKNIIGNIKEVFGIE